MQQSEPTEVGDLRIFAAIVLRGRAISIEETISRLKREGSVSGFKVLFVKASGTALWIIDAPHKEGAVEEEA